MQCPICAGEMRKGYLSNPNSPPQWIPEGKKPPFFSFSAVPEGIRLRGRFSLFKAGGFYTAEAFSCPACRTVISRAEDCAFSNKRPAHGEPWSGSFFIGHAFEKAPVSYFIWCRRACRPHRRDRG